MQGRYPLFEENRILKKEALIAIRDYSYDQMGLTWQDFSFGILSGCSILVEGAELVISPGIIKYDEKILLLPEPERIPYQATDCIQYLKARIELCDPSPEFITYQISFGLALSEECMENEIEFCRFHLRQGAALRGQYKDFFDLETEYDTINLLYAGWGGKGGNSLSPFVTQFYAEEILQASGKKTEDIAFAYTCLNQSNAVAPAILKHYVNDREPGSGRRKETNKDIYRGMCTILRTAQSGKIQVDAPRNERRKILID
ncbi:hypothetical protein [Lacrimispora brassicae]